MILFSPISITFSQISDNLPVIGIFSLNYRQTSLSYINGVYVKFIEMSGAQVVPIYAYETTT